MLLRGYFFDKTSDFEAAVELLKKGPSDPVKMQLAQNKKAKRFSMPFEPEMQKEQLSGTAAGSTKDPVRPALQFNSVHEDGFVSGALITFLPVILVLGVIYMLVRPAMKSAGRGALSFGKSRARLLSLDRNRITFKDVAGVEEAKEEVQELVEFPQGPQEIPASGWDRSPKAC